MLSNVRSARYSTIASTVVDNAPCHPKRWSPLILGPIYTKGSVGLMLSRVKPVLRRQLVRTNWLYLERASPMC